MRKKDLVFYVLIVIFVALFVWEWSSKAPLQAQLNSFAKENNQLHFLSGIGPLGSVHNHADVKVYINGNAVDFSQHKYQITTSFIHFEDGIGNVIHIHATGMTIGQLFKSLKGEITNDCVALESQNYCNENKKKLKFYVNGKPSNEFGNYAVHDLDKILISYGSEDSAEIQKQMDSVTNLAPGYSAQK